MLTAIMALVSGIERQVGASTNGRIIRYQEHVIWHECPRICGKSCVSNASMSQATRSYARCSEGRIITEGAAQTSLLQATHVHDLRTDLVWRRIEASEPCMT